MRRLQSVRLHWWLGRRLLRAPGQRWALSALALTSTLSALLILGLSAVPDVLHDRQDAEAARTVTDTGKSTGVKTGLSVPVSSLGTRVANVFTKRASAAC